MTDELDVLTRVVDYHDHIAAPTVSVADDVRRGRRRVARRRRLAAGGAALAVAGIVLTASLVSPSDPDGTPDPARTPTPTETHTATDPVPSNDRITTAERYLAGKASHYDWRSFDPVSATGLFVASAHGRDERLKGLAVVGRTGPVATLTCARDLQCSPEYNWGAYTATLGPGADEVTVESGDRTAQVIGYDGTLRRTIDLTATIADDEDVRGLRWSPDGSRLAVATVQYRGNSWRSASRLWLVDREGGDAQLAYSLWQDRQAWVDRQSREDTPSGFDGTGLIWTASGWGWSPDGQSLLLDVVIGNNRSDVVVLHLLPDGAASPVMAQTLYHSNRHFDWAGNVAWSPDGTRIAVRTSPPGPQYRHRVTEISAEDGHVIAQHPHLNGWLIWTARTG